jgi:hypothetical protein
MSLIKARKVARQFTRNALHPGSRHGGQNRVVEYLSGREQRNKVSSKMVLRCCALGSLLSFPRFYAFEFQEHAIGHSAEEGKAADQAVDAGQAFDHR